MRKKLIISIIIFLILAAAVAAWLIVKNQKAEVDGKLKICPDSWIENQMPKVVSGKQKETSADQYFILDGQRREMSEFDLDWVKNNCNLKPQVVR